MVVPSRGEAFGQTASEAQSCGTPAVAFDTSGLRDIVDHKVTGYIAKAFESSDLAKVIEWVLTEQERQKTMGDNARQKAVEKFAYGVVARNYMGLYGNLI